MTADIQTAQEDTNLAPSELIEESLRRDEGILSDSGALLVTTGKRTGRSPADRFIVREPSTEDSIDWGSVNRPFDPDKFDALRNKVIPDLIKGRPRREFKIWSAACSIGAEPYSLAILCMEILKDRRVTIVGSDIDRQAIESAKKGTYSNYMIGRTPSGSR